MSEQRRFAVARNARVSARRTLSFVALAASCAAASTASAQPGTHPLVISTWDSRASSVVLGYRHGFLDGGGFDVVSYHANFSATSGKLSSQFGLYYETYSAPGASIARGLAGSATALFNLPMTRRLDNGLPVAALGLYVGSAPTALISGERNYISIPLVLGAGVSVTPAKAISITPWFEFSPSVNLDTVIHQFDLSSEDPTKYIDPTTGQLKPITASDVENIISKSVELKTSVAVGARAGLDLSLHLSDYVDFAAGAALSSTGSAFSGARVFYFGGGLVWRWDDIVPAVLPAEKRLLHESCDDVELRFRSCPNSRKWKSPETLEQLSAPLQPAAPNASPNPPTSTPANSAPTTPAAPSPTPDAAPAVPSSPATPSGSPAPANGSFVPNDVGADTASGAPPQGSGAFPVQP